MTTTDDGPDDATAPSLYLGRIVLFAVVWFGLLWLLIAVLAAHAYRIGEAAPFRYVGF